MIITGEAKRWCPAWFCRHTTRLAVRLVQGNPGFHRVIIQVRPGPRVELEHLADPNIEPSVRRLLGRIMRLDPLTDDDDPYVLL